MKRVQIFLCLLLLAACSLPATTVRSVDARPSISIAGAGSQAELFVDGLRVGKASEFQEPNQLTLPPGTHKIAIIDAGRPAFEQVIFIESEHKTIIAR